MITHHDWGRPAFKIQDSKTKAGIREVPISSKLLPLYAHLLTLSDEKNGYFFAGGKNKYNNRLDYLSKQFGRLKKSLGYDGRHVFHSFRKTVTTELHRAGCGLGIIPYIVGHETGSITYDIYSAGPSMEQKKAAIEKLSFDFDYHLD